MEFTWERDAEDGVYKQRALSNRLLKAAAREFKITPFTTKVDGFGKRQGESVTLVHYKPVNVPNSPQLSEHQRVPIDKLEMGGRIIVVQEWGRGLQYTSLAQDLSKFNPKNAAQAGLIEQMQACMDNGAAAAFKESKIRFTPTSLTGGTIDVNATFSTQATQNMTHAHMALLRDYLATDLHTPYFEGENYIGLMTTRLLRGLKNDRTVELWHQYLRKGDLIFRSELFRVEQIRCVEITNEDALSNSVGAGSCLGEGLVFGKDAVSRVEASTPELRADPNYQGDFGRVKAVMWHGLINFGITWDSANDREARVIYIGSKDN